MAIAVTTSDFFGGAPSAPTFGHRFSVVLDNSYPAGGYLLGLQARVGAGRTIADVWAVGKVTASGVPDLRRYYYDRTADKLYAVLANGSGEVVGTTDLSAITVELMVLSY